MSRYIRRNVGPGAWEGVEPLDYKEEGSAPFRAISRQVLFDGSASQLRYFEVAPGGYSTLERHEHTHAVLILRGRGSCLIGSEIHLVARHDLVEVPPLTWHQFRAAADEPLGFLCMVDSQRDRPQLPDASALAELQQDPAIRAFLAGD